jgi:hypothetical protein
MELLSLKSQARSAHKFLSTAQHIGWLVVNNVGIQHNDSINKRTRSKASYLYGLRGQDSYISSSVFKRTSTSSQYITNPNTK